MAPEKPKIRKSAEIGICVPVSILALSINSKANANGLEFVGASADFSKLPKTSDENPKPYLSNLVTASPFAGMQTRDPGIHLHWVLPDALTTTDGRPGNEAKFLNVPNRWLVGRRAISTDRAGNKVCKQDYWVVESDYIANKGDANSITVPQGCGSKGIPSQNNGDGRLYQYMGRKVNLADWQDQLAQGNNADSDYFTDLSALGYGEPLFSAFYSNSQNCFGMFDDLKGLEAEFSTRGGSLSYQMIGWFADQAQDPVHRFSSLQECLDANQWSVPEGSQMDAGFTLYHGSVLDIPWNDQSRNNEPEGSKAGKLPDKVYVSLGCNGVEALSCLIARLCIDKHGGGQANLEQILNALQLGLVTSKGYENLDAEEISEALHQSGFVSSASQKTWMISAQDKSRDLPPLPENIAQMLDRLNVLQAGYDSLSRKLTGLRAQLFLDYWRWVYLKHPGGDPLEELSDIDPNQIMARLWESMEDIDKNKSLLQEKGRDRELVIGSLTDALGQEYKLVQIQGGARFWKALDPVVLLAGQVARPSEHFGNDGRNTADNRLKCRFTNQIISGLSYSGNETKTELTAAELPALQKIRLFPHPAEFQDLVRESYILDEFYVRFALAERSPQPSSQDLDDLVSLLEQSLQNSQPASAKLEFQGELPSHVASHTWEEEWNPIMLQWEVSYRPAANFNLKPGPYDKDFISKDFELHDGELIYNQPDIPEDPQKNYPIYSGCTVLTPGARSSLKYQLNEFLQKDPDIDPEGELRKLLDQLNDIPILSQSLDGLSGSMLMKWPELQMDVRDPFDLMNKEFIDRIRDTVEEQNSHTPLTNDLFNPIRAGLCQITKLWLVDSYGQHREIINQSKAVSPTKVAFSQSLLLPQKLDRAKYDPSACFFLPPRVNQSSRLQFRWLSADADMECSSHPSTSPICGWLFPNYYESSLMAYDRDGNAKGSLILSADQEKVLWANAPGSSDPDAPMESVIAGLNPHFLKTLYWIFNQGESSHFHVMWRIIQDVLPCMDPDYTSESAIESLMLGEPLAIVRARLDLELENLPGINQSWKDFEDFAAGKAANEVNAMGEFSEYMKRNRGSFTQVSFPIQLGNKAKGSDGFVGFFDGDPFQGFTADKKILLNLEPGANSCSLVMLINPRFKVHAYSGILPVKEIDIPSSQYQPILDRLQITFFNAPVIMNAVEPAMALPNAKNATWSWIERTGNGWTAYPEGVNADKPEEDWKSIGKVDEKENKSMSPLSVREGWLRMSKK